MERPIEGRRHEEAGSRPVQQLDSAPADPQVEADELRVITQEGDVAVIRDLLPERGTTTTAEPVVEPSAEPIAEEAAPLRAPDGATQMRYRMLVAGHVASDIFCLNVVLFATNLLDAIVVSRSLGSAGWLLAIVGSVAWVSIFHAFGLYGSKNLSSSEEIRRVVGAASVGAALLMIVSVGGLPVASERKLGLAFVLLIVLEVLSRLAWRT